MAKDDRIDVLLGEDNPDDAEFTLRALRKADSALSVVRVDNGVKALDFLFGTGTFVQRATLDLPRVMLLDLKMPKVDGLEVLKLVKTDRRTRALPVVVLTSSREQRDIDNSYLLGANSYIVKPVDYGEFVATVGECVQYWLQLNEPHAARIA